MIETLKHAWEVFIAFLRRNKQAILAAGMTALVLDVIFGIIFGIGGGILGAAIL